MKSLTWEDYFWLIGVIYLLFAIFYTLVELKNTWHNKLVRKRNLVYIYGIIICAIGAYALITTMLEPFGIKIDPAYHLRSPRDPFLRRLVVQLYYLTILIMIMSLIDIGRYITKSNDEREKRKSKLLFICAFSISFIALFLIRNCGSTDVYHVGRFEKNRNSVQDIDSLNKRFNESFKDSWWRGK